jgi:hypothetical protein
VGSAAASVRTWVNGSPSVLREASSSRVRSARRALPVRNAFRCRPWKPGPSAVVAFAARSLSPSHHSHRPRSTGSRLSAAGLGVLRVGRTVGLLDIVVGVQCWWRRPCRPRQ